jgi:hypothetical protein
VVDFLVGALLEQEVREEDREEARVIDKEAENLASFSNRIRQLVYIIV